MDDHLDYDVDLEGDDESNSSPSVAGEVTIAVAGVSTGDSPSPLIHTGKRPRIDDFAIPVILPGSVKKPSAAFDESRKLFQRLWTDEDEIELLRGFLDYTTQRGLNTSSQQHHYDTTAFYDQIKSKFQLDFNKNQLVEKLRRLKKKYRTVMSKMGPGKDFVFKSAHDQVTFEISHKIWSSNGGSYARSSPGGTLGFSAPPLEDGGLDDEDQLNPNPPNSDSHVLYQSPKFNLKELLNNMANLNGSAQVFGFGFGGVGLSPIPLGFGGGEMSMEMMEGREMEEAADVGAGGVFEEVGTGSRSGESTIGGAESNGK